MTDIFDKFLNAFSAKNLGSRVKTTIIIGTILCAATAVAGYLLLTKTLTISVDGAITSSETDEPGKTEKPLWKLLMETSR